MARTIYTCFPNGKAKALTMSYDDGKTADERLLEIKVTDEGKKLRKKAADIPQAIAGCTGLTAEEFMTLYKLAYKALNHMEKRDE